MKLNQILLSVFLSCYVISVKSARILAWFPSPSISHQVVFRPVTEELAKRGHEVTVITTDPAFPPGQAPSNLTEIDVHDMSYNIWMELIFSSDLTKGSKDDIISQMRALFRGGFKVFETQLKSKVVQDILQSHKTKKYDLLILEAVPRSIISVSHLLKIPVISFSSFFGFGGIYDVMGAPSRSPLLYPTFWRQRIHNLSLMDKISELCRHYLFESIYLEAEEFENQAVKKIFGPDTPDLKKMDNNIDLAFINVHPLWEMNRPVPLGIVYLGGLHQKPQQELPKSRLRNIFMGKIT